MEKLVCEHGDFFCVVHGELMPYSKAGESCTGEMYGREIRGGKTQCGECGAQPGGHHLLYCSKERCPHCARKLLACLARKYGIRNMTQFKRQCGLLSGREH